MSRSALVAASAGLAQVFPNGGDKTKQFIIETTGSGPAFLGYDNDGLLDIFIMSGHGGLSRLYHNEGHGRFIDVTLKTMAHRDGARESARPTTTTMAMPTCSSPIT
jgi:hypothetical protein